MEFGLQKQWRRQRKLHGNNDVLLWVDIINWIFEEIKLIYRFGINWFVKNWKIKKFDKVIISVIIDNNLILI